MSNGRELRDELIRTGNLNPGPHLITFHNFAKRSIMPVGPEPPWQDGLNCWVTSFLEDMARDVTLIRVVWSNATADVLVVDHERDEHVPQELPWYYA